MKYTFKALPLAAFALTAALLFSSHDASALAGARTSHQNLHTGSVTCFLSHDNSTVRLRRFIDYVQVGPTENIQVIDDGFGLDKAVGLITNYCRAQTIALCNYSPITPLSTSTATGSLFSAPFTWNCQ